MALISRAHPQLLPSDSILARNVSWAFAGNVVYGLCQWGVLAAIARMGTPATVGHFAYALALTAPVILFANLELRSVQATDARGLASFAEYQATRGATTLIALGAIALIVAALRLESSLGAVTLFIAGAKAFEALADSLHGTLQQRERLDRVGQSQILRGLASVAVVATVMRLSGSLVHATAALALCWLAVLLAFDVGAVRRLQRQGGVPAWELPSLARVLALVRRTLPLGVAALLTSLNANIPRYVIEYHRGAADLGVFAACAYVIVAGKALTTALGQALMPRLGVAHARGDMDEFNRVIRSLVLIAVAVGGIGLLVALAFGRQLLGFLYGTHYSGAYWPFVVLMAAAVFGYAAPAAGAGLLSAGKFRTVSVFWIAIIVVTIVTSLALIPRFGLMGASAAVLASLATELTGGLYLLRRAVRQRPNPARAIA